MLHAISLYLTVALTVVTFQYRVFGIMYVRMWEFALIFCLITWLGKIGLTKRINIRFDSLNIAITIFLLINVFSSIRVPEHAGKFMQGGMWYNMRTIEPVLLYYIISDYLAESKHLRPFMYCLLTVLVVQCSLGLAQALGGLQWPPTEILSSGEFVRGYFYYLTGYGNPSVSPAYGTFDHFNNFGMYLSIFVLPLASFVLYKTGLNRRLTLPVFALTVITLFLTYSRGSLLGAAIGIFVMVIIGIKGGLTRVALALVLFLMLVSVVAGSVAINRGYVDTLNLTPRIELWQETLHVIFKDPLNFIFGTGSGTHLYWVQHESRGHLYSPHNTYLIFWLETGLLGLLSLLSVFGIYFMKVVKSYLANSKGDFDAIIFSMIGIVPCLLVEFMFEATFVDLSTKALIFTFMALGSKTCQARQSKYGIHPANMAG